jgi:hypothetical protein
MRTEQQNKALHLWFRQVAEALASQEFDFRELKIEIAPTEYLVKEYMWKPVEKAVTGKTSTTQLEKSEVSEIYDILNKALGEKFGIHIPFPEDESH